MEVREVRVSDVNRQKLQELQEDPRVKQRLQIMLVLGLAFVGSAVVIGGIGLSGMIPVQQNLSEGGLWWIMVGLAVAELPAMVFITGNSLAAMTRAPSFGAAAAGGLTSLVLGLALAESIAVYSLVGGMMAMPQAAQGALLALSVVALLVALVVVRGRVGQELARRLYVEAEQQRRR